MRIDLFSIGREQRSAGPGRTGLKAGRCNSAPLHTTPPVVSFASFRTNRDFRRDDLAHSRNHHVCCVGALRRAVRLGRGPELLSRLPGVEPFGDVRQQQQQLGAGDRDRRPPGRRSSLRPQAVAMFELCPYSRRSPGQERRSDMPWTALLVLGRRRRMPNSSRLSRSSSRVDESFWQ